MDKKIVVRFLAAAVLCGVLPGVTGCTDIASDIGSQEAVQMEVSGTASTTFDTALTDAAAETAAETMASAETETDDGMQTQTDTAAEEQAAETVGSTGMTSAECCAMAQGIYDNAAAVAFSYFGSTGGCLLDESDVLEDGFLRVTNYSTEEEACAAYFAVFSKTYHGSDLNGSFRTVDDKLYCCLGERGSDISYVSTDVTQLTAYTDDSLTFTAVSTYQSPVDGERTTTSDTFSLVLENGSWMVAQFTLPF